MIMEYQKLANLLDYTPNHPSQVKKKIWIELNDDSNGKYNTNSQIKFRTLMLRSSLCDYSDGYFM